MSLLVGTKLFCTIRLDKEVELSNCDDTVGNILFCMIRFDKEVEILTVLILYWKEKIGW